MAYGDYDGYSVQELLAMLVSGETPDGDPIEGATITISNLPSTLGQKLAAASLGVVLASDQTVEVDLSGEDHLGSVGGHTPEIRGTLNSVSPGIVAAGGDYAAGNVLSQSASNGIGLPWVFDNAARLAGGTGYVTKLTASLSVAAVTARLRIWLFKVTPATSEMDDRAAFSLDADDRASCLGYIDLPAFINAGEVAWAQNVELHHAITCSGDDKLFGIVQTLDAFTNEVAGMTLDLWLSVDQN